MNLNNDIVSNHGEGHLTSYDQNQNRNKYDNSPSHTWLIILIRFITLKNIWMNPCVKTVGKYNESVNNEFKIMRNSDSLHQIMRVDK